MASYIPKSLAYLIELNIDFEVIVCITCYKAITPTGIDQHIRKTHNLEPSLRKELQEYMNSFKNSYSPSTIRLPANNSTPQPILPIVDGFLTLFLTLFLWKWCTTSKAQ